MMAFPVELAFIVIVPFTSTPSTVTTKLSLIEGSNILSLKKNIIGKFAGKVTLFSPARVDVGT